MEKVLLLNPVAGHGDASKLTPNYEGALVYNTTCVGDAEQYTYEHCKINPKTHFIVCGGDGTINEVVNGIMRSGAADEAAFSVIPTGSGNDFVKNELAKGEMHRIDVLKYNDKYAINMINIGFDCDVVAKQQHYKNTFSGPMSYIAGVGTTLLRKMGYEMTLDLTYTNGETETITKNFLLCAISNGSFCGGGFKFSPEAKLDDGIFEILMVNKISRAKFISVVGEFKKGNFINENGEIEKKFVDILQYVKCKSAKITGMKNICIDGEVTESNSVEISIEHKAINFIS